MTMEATRPSDEITRGMTPEELAAEEVTALPDKEVASILDLNVDLDLALDLAAPIDLAVAANANVAAPIDAAVSANVLAVGSTAQGLSDQGGTVTQGIVGDATAHADQVADIDQSDDEVGGDEPAPAPAPVEDSASSIANVGDALTGIDTGGVLSGDLLEIDVNVAADVDLAAPIAGAVAANANVAAPIDAAVAANVGTILSEAVAVSNQDAIINQSIEGDATATAEQDAEITQ